MGSPIFPNKPAIPINQPAVPGGEQVIKQDFPHPLIEIGPDHAKLVERATGDTGVLVAIAGFSDTNFGVFASSDSGIGLSATGGQLAAQFNGGVEIDGDCLTTGGQRTRGDHRCDGNMHTFGNLTVEGDIQLGGADYAEDFEISNAEGAAPGMVMVLDDLGGVRVSEEAYDRRVAGVISGAGGYRPAVILDRHDTDTDRRPLALMGKVYCRVDANASPIAVGDLLTTSTTRGHAMKAADPARAFGAVIGKALGPLVEGYGLVPILVALQ